MKNMQKGRSMVEMLAVLAIAGALTVGALSGIRSAINKGKLLLTEGFYHDIRFSVIDRCMSGAGCPFQDYKTGFAANQDLLCKGDDIPSAFCKGGNNKVGDFTTYTDGAWNMGTTTVNGTRLVVATLVNLPDTVCSDVVLSDVPKGAAFVKVGSHLFDAPEHHKNDMAAACENRSADSYFGAPILSVYWTP